MPRRLKPEPLVLADVFRKAQTKMMGDLTMGRAFAHAPTQGTASEQQWLRLLEAYLPSRYRAAPAFIINSEGESSWQIDAAIYDNSQSPPLFPHAAGVHIPIESVYAVFEVKTLISRASLRDVGLKAESVRVLRSGRRLRPILSGVLATSSVWAPHKLETNLRRVLKVAPKHHEVDLGCALEQGAFENGETQRSALRRRL